MLRPRKRAVSVTTWLELSLQRAHLRLPGRGLAVRLCKLPHRHIAVQAWRPRPVLLQQHAAFPDKCACMIAWQSVQCSEPMWPQAAKGIQCSTILIPAFTIPSRASQGRVHGFSAAVAALQEWLTSAMLKEAAEPGHLLEQQLFLKQRPCNSR